MAAFFFIAFVVALLPKKTMVQIETFMGRYFADIRMVTISGISKKFSSFADGVNFFCGFGFCTNKLYG